jgi:hypothetical protein
MPWFKNDQARVLGLSFKADAGNPRLLQPGEVFEANQEDIPKHYLDNKWVIPAEAPKSGTTTAAAPGDQPQSPPDAGSATAQTGSGQFTGPDPVQGSGTSVLESSTDKEAQDSGAYDRGDQSNKRRK